jgi:carboxylesterase type B
MLIRISKRDIFLMLVLLKFQTDKTKKLPVVVYIHGGFFLWGSSASHTPGYLLEHDVVMVSIQYRLGPLGEWLCNRLDSRAAQVAVASS